jgi:hypothetical protein
MLKHTIFILCAMLICGCAAKRGSTSITTAPEPGTREALLPTYKPTGSACLDSVVANMLYAGCSYIASTQSADGLTNLIGCLRPQPGAQDIFSRGTILHTVDLAGIPPEASPFCGDPTGIYATWSIPFTELIQNEQ